MDKTLEARLFERYPEIFRERNLPKESSEMYWGLQVGDGWHPLLESLCRDLQNATDTNGSPQVVATQVKSKFGRLRFHAHRQDDRQKAMIELAEEASARTCDICGAPGELVPSRRSSSTRCAQHRAEDTYGGSNG